MEEPKAGKKRIVQFFAAANGNSKQLVATYNSISLIVKQYLLPDYPLAYA